MNESRIELRHNKPPAQLRSVAPLRMNSLIRLRRAFGYLLTLNFAIVWATPIFIQEQAYRHGLNRIFNRLYRLIDEIPGWRQFAVDRVYRMMQIPEVNNRFDAAYAFEATVHAPDETELFREVFRILHPGGCFASYEWCLTENHNPSMSEHRQIKENIMLGNGLPDIPRTKDVHESLKKAGFEILKVQDLAYESDPKMPWYRALEGYDFTLTSLPRTPLVAF